MASRSSRSRQTVQQRPAENQDSIPQQVVNFISYPFTACIPSSSSSNSHSSQDQEQRQSLLTDHAYEDSDAISLLSNIANRSRRRNRAARRRERWNSSTAIIGCGLFGRPKGQIQQRQRASREGERRQIGGHARSVSQDSNISAEISTDDESGRTGSFAAAQESGDEDAGMLNDDAIANLSLSREEEDGVAAASEEDANAKMKREEEAAAALAAAAVQKAKEEQLKAKEEEEAARRKEELERQAVETARIEAENAAKQKAEEEALAAEEEAAVAKARRKAERKAIKQGLLEAKAQGQRGTRRMTEAEAEAAAGGFDFAEEIQAEQHSAISPEYDQDQQDVERYDDQYGLAYGPEGYGYDENYSQQAQQEVVHHHHYYHEPEQDESMQSYTISQPPTTFVTEHYNGDQKHQAEEAVVEEDEDDADIAGLAFSKNRKNRLDKDGGSYASRSNGSGSGSRQSARYEKERDRMGGSNDSARRRESLLTDGGSSTGGGSGSGKFTYRDRPRRHERTGSRSAGSGSARVLREGPGGKVVTSPTIPESDQSKDLSFSSATVMGSDDRADAAAGGFDDFLSPANSSTLSSSTQTPWTPEYQQGDNFNRSPSPNQGIKTSFSPASSTSAKAGRRREMPRTQLNGITSNLNAPRNPAMGNIFGRKDDYDDEADVEGF